MSSLYVINSSAGQRRSEEMRRQLEKALGTSDAEGKYTSASGDAEKFAFDATMSGRFDSIVACGGDGTVNEVANGILRGCGLSGNKPAMGLLPFGTCNVLCTELGIPLEFSGAVGVLMAGNRRKMDVGMAGDRYFLLMLSCGIDAEIVRRVFPQMKDLVGAPAYIMSALPVLAGYKPSLVTLAMDDQNVTTHAYMVTVSNIPSYAFEHVKVAPFAAIDDGWLDICVFEQAPMQAVGFLTQLLLLLARRHLHDPRIRYYRARHVTIESDPAVAYQIDGESIGNTPVEISLLPRALEVIVP